MLVAFDPPHPQRRGTVRRRGRAPAIGISLLHAADVPPQPEQIKYRLIMTFFLGINLYAMGIERVCVCLYIYTYIYKYIYIYINIIYNEIYGDINI